MPSAPPRPLIATVVTLLLAAAGGTLFFLLDFPAPWLSGGMIGAVAGMLCGIELHMPHRLRDAIVAVTGASMGATITPATLQAMAHWPLSLVVLIIAVGGIMAAAVVAARPWGWDRDTAIFASAPGAFSTVLILAEEMRANLPRVIVAQSLRIFILVAVLPWVVAVLEPGALATTPVRGIPGLGLITGPLEYAVILVLAVSGAVLFYTLKVPAGLLLGACVGNALLHATGLVTAPVPQSVLIPCYVMLGAFMALRFKGSSWQAFKGDIGASLAVFLAALTVSLVGAAAVAKLLDIPFAAALVAFAPGGIEAMIIMAFALGLDVAYVGTHHLVRFVGIAMLLPPFIAFLHRREGPKGVV